MLKILRVAACIGPPFFAAFSAPAAPPSKIDRQAKAITKSAILMALTADDIVRAHRHHKIAGLTGIEGGHAIEDSTRPLRVHLAEGRRCARG